MDDELYINWKFDESSDYDDDHYRLIVTKPALKLLIDDLQRVYEADSLGEFEHQIDTELLVPFQKIEIVESVPERSESEAREHDLSVWWWIAIVSVPLLALYGLVRVAMDVLS